MLSPAFRLHYHHYSRRLPVSDFMIFYNHLPSFRKLQSQAPIRGFAMVEVLITLLVISFGMLGMFKLQTRGLQHSNSAYMRTHANLFASEIISRMQLAASAGLTVLPATISDCDTAISHSAAQRLQSNVPGVKVTCAVTRRWLSIEVAWPDARWQSGNSGDVVFKYKMKL